MKRRRIRWLGIMIPLGAIAAPFVLWVLVVLIAPTNWARSQVVHALERSSGRSAQIDKLNACLLGGIDLSGLRIGAPGNAEDPWLQAGKVHIDVSLLQLLRGRFQPSFIEVDEGSLRVLRRDDGSFELADLVRSEGEGSHRANEEPHRCGTCKLRVKLSQFQVVLADEPTQTRVVLEDVEGEGSWEGESAFVASLSGRLNQGPFQFTAHLDRSMGQPSFEGEFKTSEVMVDENMGLLRYLVPVLAGAPGHLEGRLAMDVYLRGEGRTRETLAKSLVGQGRVELDPISLGGTPLVTELGKLVNARTGERMASVRSHFVIDSGRITTDHLDLELGQVPIVVSGWTDFDGRLDYQVKLDKMEKISGRFEEQARKFLGGLDLDIKSLTRVRMTGSVDHVAVSLNPAARNQPPVEYMLGPPDRERMRALARQLKEKLLR